MKKEKKEDKVPKKRFKETSFLIIDEKEIAEQIYNPKTNISLFLVWNKEKRYHHDGIGYLNWRMVGKIEQENTIYVPIKGDELEKDCIKLPSNIQMYLDTKELLDEIKTFINKYCDVSEHFLTFASWYVLLSWVYDRMNTIPYLRLQGDTGTGKTRTQQTIGGLCYKPMFLAGAVTPAPIFRIIDKWKGTMILDEADFKMSDESQEIIKILNCGYQRGMSIIRCDQNNANKIHFFNVFCPKIIGTRQSFNDKALESRCITEITQETRRKDIPPDLPTYFFEEQEVLRNKLLLFRLANWFKIDSNSSLSIDLGNLEPRLRQATGPFATLFASEEGVLESFRAFLSNYQKELVSERAQSFDGAIVNAIAGLLINGLKDISSQDLTEAMISDGWECNVQKIGKRLKSLSILTEVKRIGGFQRRYLIINEQFISMFKRYVDDSDLLAKCVTSVTSVTSTMGEKRKCHMSESSPNMVECDKSDALSHIDVTLVTNVTGTELVAKSLERNTDIEVSELEEAYTKPIIDRCFKEGILYRTKSGFCRLL